MKTILSYSLSILYYLCFGILLFSFQIIQWFCLNMFGYYAHKKSVDILNYLILLSLSIIKTRIFFEAESNLPPPGKNVIFIANHQSTYDIPPLIWKLRNYHMKFVSKKELGRGIPSISYNLRNGGSILIDREKPKEAINSIKKFDLDPVRNGNGYRLIANTGLNGVQEVPHLHFHILGGRNMGFMVSRPQ